jgi:ubiquinol-cytochrome c reductase iron-sulfur subunit
MKALRLLGFAIAALLGWRRHRREEEEPEQIVPPGEPNRLAETAVILLLLASALCAAGFVALYAIEPPNMTQWMGLAIGVAFALMAAALIVTGLHLVVTEHNEEEYPGDHPQEREELAQVVRESGSRLTRKRLLGAAAGTAAGAMGAALVVPAASLGPLLDTDRLYRTPWRRGRRLVDEEGRTMVASDIERENFYTAYPEGADREQLGAPLILVRLDPAELALPADRRGWAPEGILAYSKICTHAGCAIALYRTPKFEPTQPKPALVCPCHYSTFDPAKGGTVEFGPAGRDLPQLPLLIDRHGGLRAAGNFSGPVGPSWLGVRSRRPT